MTTLKLMLRLYDSVVWRGVTNRSTEERGQKLGQKSDRDNSQSLGHNAQRRREGLVCLALSSPLHVAHWRSQM